MLDQERVANMLEDRAAAAADSPMIMKTVRLRPPGLAGAADSSGDTGEGLADRCAASRSIVVAMSSLIGVGG